MRHGVLRLAGAGLLAWGALMPALAQAAEYLSVSERAAVLYDAPSARAKKVFVASQFYPFEVIVSVDNWVKVRDASGDLAWIERRFLSQRRTVLIRAGVVDVRQAAQENAPLAFQAREGVALDLAEMGPAGWVRVRHRDGQSGFVRVSQVWGL
jgi:SH3-like domain-containing protein